MKSFSTLRKYHRPCGGFSILDALWLPLFMVTKNKLTITTMQSVVQYIVKVAPTNKLIPNIITLKGELNDQGD